ncbi:multicopper oxidase family protein [Nocardia sp. NPDC059180]|uniref:multicopper oxidase family protein n=1 Tax=Nocardia sp. NPDC059180 TaxID=3346761 RepID=UPI00369B658D
MISRRRLLAASVALPLAASVAGCVRHPSAPAVGTTRPLPIPPLTTGQVGADGVRRFELTARTGTTEMLPGKATPTWGYNGSVLGPALRARRGERVAFTITNNLPEATTVHWHGMRVPARCDGGPHQTIEAGGTWSPEWTVDQPAATLWYHPHPHGSTEKHVYRGLSGFFLIDDEHADGLDLPRRYGVDDIPLVIQDRRFAADGRLDETDSSTYGLLGDTIITNGISDAHLSVRTERVRLRILNGSSSRLFNLARSDDRPFDLIATDGGFLEKPLSLSRMQLSPGERAEIVLELRAGQTLTLRSLPIEPRAGLSDPAEFGFDDTFDILTLRAAPQLTPSPALPGALATITPLGAAATTRSFELQWYMINGQRMDMNRIDLTVQAGATEVWEVRNADNWPHNFHIHDVRFQVIGIDGLPPPQALSGWKDTVYTEPGRTYTLAMRFSGHTDPTYPYMYHCHLLHHEDQGMMGQFLVLGPGQQPAPMVMSGNDSGHGH